MLFESRLLQCRIDREFPYLAVPPQLHSLASFSLFWIFKLYSFQPQQAAVLRKKLC